ncbi:MAG TPA: NAD(P)H-dependent oxidoreductase [Clostridia bacterium]|nr:NAD(P)H-dependent oxidoreductase [Clostridia bacterium]
MIRILAVIGSPRKGETYQAVVNFTEELKKTEEVNVEYVMLANEGLSDCAGCHNCFMKGREYCKESGKVKELQDKMLAADAVILASPVYNQSVTALMKKFLDYFTFLWHRPELFGVKFFGISSGGGVFKEVFKLLRMNVESWGGTWLGEHGIPHYEALKPKYRLKCDRDIQKKAGLFLGGIRDNRPQRPSIGRLMMFNIWRMNAKACKDSIPPDYTYWAEKQLLDKDYYYPVRISIFKRIAVACIVGMAKSMMKKIYVGYDEV